MVCRHVIQSCCSCATCSIAPMLKERSICFPFYLPLICCEWQFCWDGCFSKIDCLHSPESLAPTQMFVGGDVSGGGVRSCSEFSIGLLVDCLGKPLCYREGKGFLPMMCRKVCVCLFGRGGGRVAGTMISRSIRLAIVGCFFAG